MTDLFEEVEEQLRSDRYKELARKFLPWMLGIAAVALAATLGYWGWDTYQRRIVSQASESYNEAIMAMQAGDAAKARKLWTEVSQGQAKGYKSLSLMHLGSFAVEENKPTDAVKLFDQAAEAAPDPVIGDAARLKSAFALMDTAPYKDVEGRLTPLMEEGRPYRLQAREALAFAKLMKGDTVGARSDFLLIQQAFDVTEGLASRAGAAISLIDSGSAKQLPAVVKNAIAAPPPMMLPPGAMGEPQAMPGAPQ